MTLDGILFDTSVVNQIFFKKTERICKSDGESTAETQPFPRSTRQSRLNSTRILFLEFFHLLVVAMVTATVELCSHH